MNGLQIIILGLAAVFIGLVLRAFTTPGGYARTVALFAAGTIMLAPFAWLICASFKDPQVLNDYTFLPPPNTWTKDMVHRTGPDNTPTLVPVTALPAGDVPKPDDVIHGTLNLKNFRVLLADKETAQGPVSFWRYVANSVFLASGITIVSMVFGSMGGFALAKYKFRGRLPIVTFMLASLTIPSVVLLAPNFEIIFKLGWMNTYASLIVPAAVSVFGIFLFRQAILGVPDELIEAGRIDGCSDFRIYFSLVMPLVRPMTGAFCLVSFLAAWNAFLGPNVFLQSQPKLTLPVVLNQYIGEYTQQYGVFLAGTLLAIIPPAVLFLSLQKEFISGLTSGGVKQ
jgi:ABC-type glycerol-3-phosphate transport system permease component